MTVSDLTLLLDDDGGHIVCLPYTVDNLHRMAKELGLARSRFRNPEDGWPYYSVPMTLRHDILDRTDVEFVSVEQLLCAIRCTP